MSDDKALREAIRRQWAYTVPKQDLIDRIEQLEAKLAEVVAVGVRVRDYFTHHSNDDVYAVHDFDEAIAELKGQNDE